MNQLLSRVAEEAGTNPEFNHPFFFKVKSMVEAGDMEAIYKEKVPLKLLRLTETA